MKKTKPVQESTWRHKFYNEYNLSVHNPQKDMCSYICDKFENSSKGICKKFENSSKEEQNEMHDEYERRKQNIENIRSNKKPINQQKIWGCLFYFGDRLIKSGKCEIALFFDNCGGQNKQN